MLVLPTKAAAELLSTKTGHPIIMLSTAVEQPQLWQELGAKGYLQKPSDLMCCKKH